MRITCHQCRSSFELTDAHVEESVSCPSCGAGLNATEETNVRSEWTEIQVDRRSAAMALHEVEEGESASLSYLVATETGELKTLLDECGQSELAGTFEAGGTLQARYVLEHELGRGGMGRVFLGRDTRLNRVVAIKVMLPLPGSGKAGVNAFVEEARLGASLLHPAIATVFDFGFENGKPFTVFEYAGGETLAHMLKRRGRLPLEEVRMILTPLAQALDFAHGRHVVHRDLKPANIRATEQGHFSIAIRWSCCGCIATRNRPR